MPIMTIIYDRSEAIGGRRSCGGAVSLRPSPVRRKPGIMVFIGRSTPNGLNLAGGGRPAKGKIGGLNSD
jgi:hypothetical protein